LNSALANMVDGKGPCHAPLRSNAKLLCTCMPMIGQRIAPPTHNGNNPISPEAAQHSFTEVDINDKYGARLRFNGTEYLGVAHHVLPDGQHILWSNGSPASKVVLVLWLQLQRLILPSVVDAVRRGSHRKMSLETCVFEVPFCFRRCCQLVGMMCHALFQHGCHTTMNCSTSIIIANQAISFLSGKY